MAQFFNFQRLVKKYSTEFVATLPPVGDWNDSGEWVEGEPTNETLHGAILSHRQTKIYRSEGTLTAQDKALYMLEPLKNSLQGAKITYGDKLYSIGDMLENSEFTGVWAYTLKYISAFGGDNK